MKICILGASSHIARGLVFNFLQEGEDDLYLFDKGIYCFNNYTADLSSKKVRKIGLSDKFESVNFDAIINCIGIGDPAKLKQAGGFIFDLTEKFDNKILKYLEKHKRTLYINLSSGAVFGKSVSKPINNSTLTTLDLNNIQPEDYYSITKINCEAKHRAHPDLRIIDLRVFSYFSRFISLETGFFMTDVINALLEDRVLETQSGDMVRDFIHPSDFFALVKKCLAADDINAAFDVVSRKPVKKTEILIHFKDRFGLKYKFVDKEGYIEATGAKNSYFSKNLKAKEILDFIPEHSSLRALEMETETILLGAKCKRD
ncbi:MAG: NAD-dependent epimerase/dehydratase family protein [Patescibacteria group bacterium]